MQSKLFGMVPYIDPKKFNRQNIIQPYILNEKSDVYSVGVLLWEISSGHPPFKDELYIGLVIEISQGCRETTVPDTPDDYSKLYKGKNYYLYNLKILLNFNMIVFIYF